MKTLFFIFLYSVFCYSQILTENFNDYLPDTTDTKLIAVYLPGINETVDFSPNSKALSDNNGSGTMAGILYNGSLARTFNGTSDYYSLASPGLNFSNDSMTVIIVYKSSASGSNTMRFLSWDNGSTQRNWLYAFNSGSNNLRFDLWIGNAANNTKTATTTAGLFDGNYHIAALRYDGVNMQWYFDGQTDGTPTAKSGNTDNDATDFIIGKFTTIEYFDGQIEAIYIYEKALSDHDIKCFGYIQNGWVSFNGSVTRDNFAFSQGIIADSAYRDTLLTVGNWSVTVNLKGASGGETVNIITSSDKVNWTSLSSISVTSTATNYTINGSGS